MCGRWKRPNTRPQPGVYILGARFGASTFRDGLMRILVVQTAFLGDIVLTTPLLRELRRVHPTASLWVVTTENGRRLLAGSADADRLLVLDKRWVRAGIWTLPAALQHRATSRYF